MKSAEHKYGWRKAGLIAWALHGELLASRPMELVSERPTDNGGSRWCRLKKNLHHTRRRKVKTRVKAKAKNEMTILPWCDLPSGRSDALMKEEDEG